MYTYVCMYVYACVHAYTYVCMHARVCMYVCSPYTVANTIVLHFNLHISVTYNNQHHKIGCSVMLPYLS